MRKILFTLLCAFSALFFLPNAVVATDYAPMGDLPASPSQSSTLPIYTGSGTFTSITQQLYYASELTAAGASAGDITALKFYFGNKTTTVREVTRNLEIFIKLVPTSFTEFEVGFTNTDKYTYKFTDPGSASTNKVFDGNYTIPATANSGDKIERTISTSRFYWDGTSNILVTIIDKTNKKFYSMSGDDYSDFNLKSYGIVPAVTASRFVHQYWTLESSSEFTTYKNSLDGKFGYCSKNSTVEATERTAHSYVNIVKFTIEPHEAPVAPSVPEDLAASNVGTTTASLSWSAVDGATSYDLYNSTSIDGVYSKFASPTTNSFEWTGLTASTTYFVKVAAVNDAGTSALSDPIYFTTQAPHIHDGITFEPWSNPAALPTSGNYYLNDDVAFGIMSSDVTLTGNLNLCLNGKTADIYGSKIIIPSGKTLTIYDNEGGGKITGFVASEVGISEDLVTSLIVVKGGGTLVLKQGTIENTYVRDADGNSYAIYSNGTVRISGNVLINSNDADIYLYASNIITIDGAISNSEKHTVWKNDGIFTSGWSTHMSGENPRDFFESANSARGVCLKDGEAALRTALNLSEISNNSSIGTHYNQVVDVNLTRSLTSSQFNTFCLPFALDDDRLQELFGAGYDLEEFVSSSLEGDVLSLEFSKVTSLEAGKPYLIQPAVDVVNPSFEGVTIAATSPDDQTSDANISFHGTFAPTELAGGNENLLFLGVGNELFWPEATGNLKAFRAYFEVKGGAAKVAKRARIVQKGEQTQAIDLVENPNAAHKRIIDGQLVIEKNGMLFNAQGQMVK